jgi:NOL1/NOP2/sun family putative RNA methylase
MTNPTPDEYFSEYSEIVPDFEVFCRKLSDPLPVHLRINTLKATVTKTRLRLERYGYLLVQEESVPMVFRAENITRPGHILEFSLGHLHSQALSSVLAVLALGPKPVDVVLDLCAAPGSKTSLIAQLMKNKGTIVANEKKPNRLLPLRTNLKRLGVTNTITVRSDGQHFPKKFTFDRILVDVPCSSEGTLRAGLNGSFRWPTRPGKKLPRLQRDLLLRAFDLLKPGGTLVYSTCTYNPEENESVVQFLLENRQATVRPITLDLPHTPGLDRWKETTYDPSVKQCWRLYPHQLDTVGFFLARIDKRG